MTDFNNVTLRISTEAITVVSSPPSVDNLSGFGIIRGAVFTWDAKSLGSYYWEYRTKVGSLAWSSWTRINVNFLHRMVTAVEWAEASVAYNTTIYIEVRKSDGTGTQSANAAPVGADIGDDDLGTITLSGINSEIGLSNIPDALITNAKLAGSITDGKLVEDYIKVSEVDGSTIEVDSGSLGVVDAGIGATQLASNAVETAKVKDLQITNAKIAAATIEPAKLHSDVTDRMFRSGDRGKVETALGCTLNSLVATDVILVAAGTNKNILANASSIKADLSLSNVPNYSAVNMINNGLTDGNLVTTTTAVISGNSTKNQQVIAAINASSEATKIGSAAITELSCAKIKENTLTSAIFDNSGNLKIGIYDSASGNTISAADINSAINHTNGYAQNLDLGSIATGNLDDIDDGSTYEKTTVNEVLGAGYAYTGLHSSGANKVGTRATASGITVTPTQIESRAYGRRVLAQSHTLNSAGSAAITSLSITGTGVLISDCLVADAIICEGDQKIYVKLYARSSATANGTFQARLKEWDGTLVDTSSTVTISQSSYSVFEATLDASSLSDGDPVTICVDFTDGAGDTIDVSHWVITAGID